MSRDADPVSGVPGNGRYDSGQDFVRGDAGTYNFVGTTLEEEAKNGGWTFGARPTGPPPRDLMTIGMRGEPGYDDDPCFGNDGQVTHEDGQKPLTGIIDVD